MERIKLQKYFTDCGIMSRRAAEAEIERGAVRVNGEVAALGTRILAGVDTVEYKGKRVLPQKEEKICIMLNKPRGFVTTMSDERGRPTVHTLTSDVGCRVYPVGRLDMDSDGLLLLTNDGALAERLTHPKHTIPKIYHVTVTGAPAEEDIKRLSSPMTIDGYEIQPVRVRIIKKYTGKAVLEMTLYEGRNRQIRKMCASVGIKIERLSRVAIGALSLGSLANGKWRRLTEEEIAYLYGEKRKEK